MRRLSFPMILIALAAAACAGNSRAPAPAEAQDELQARLDAADCLELRVAMREAIEAGSDAGSDTGSDTGGEATVEPQSGDVDLDAGQPEGMASLIIPLPLGTIKRTLEGDEEAAAGWSGDVADPDVLYRRAHATYEGKGCQPTVPYGEY